MRIFLKRTNNYFFKCFYNMFLSNLSSQNNSKLMIGYLPLNFEETNVFSFKSKDFLHFPKKKISIKSWTIDRSCSSLLFSPISWIISFEALDVLKKLIVWMNRRARKKEWNLIVVHFTQMLGADESIVRSIFLSLLSLENLIISRFSSFKLILMM